MLRFRIFDFRRTIDGNLILVLFLLLDESQPDKKEEEEFSTGPLSVLTMSVKQNTQVTADIIARIEPRVQLDVGAVFTSLLNAQIGIRMLYPGVAVAFGDVWKIIRLVPLVTWSCEGIRQTLQHGS